MPSSNKRLKGLQSTSSPSTTADQPARVLEKHKGITYLPLELLLEIVSGFSDNPSDDQVEYRKGLNVIRALSQTCRGLRSIFLPILWKQLEACTIVGAGAWHIQVGRALERKSKGLLASSHLVPYVQVVIVTLTRYQTSTILPAFAQCLSILPNLHTIKIVHAHSKMMSHLKSAFEGKTFPSVQTISLPSSAHAILRCCPGIKDVTCIEGDGSTLISALAAGKCINLMKLKGVTPNAFMAKRLAKAAPNLSSIFIRANLETIKALAAIKSLNTLGIEFPSTLNSHGQKPGSETIIDAARTVMRGSKYKGEKSIILKLNRCKEVSLPMKRYEVWTETEVITM